MKNIFGDRYYFELQENGIPQQQVVNTGLRELSAELDIKCLATNDCHYLNKDEAHAHEVLLCIQTGKTITDHNRFKFSSDDYYFKSPDEMKKLFDYCPQAIASTVEVANRCNLEIELGNYHFPKFPVPEGETLESMFTKACWDGLQERFDTKFQEVILEFILEHGGFDFFKEFFSQIFGGNKRRVLI